MWQSLRGYIPAVFQWWWVMVVGGIGGGLGVFERVRDTVPIPDWGWYGIALLGVFVAQFLAFNAVRKEKGNSKEKQRVSDILGALLEEGRRFRESCFNEKEPLPFDQINDWANRTEDALRRKLGESYVSRFRSSAGLPMAAIPISSVPHRNAWGIIPARMARLEKFLEELSAH